MSSIRQALGSWGENLAADYLLVRGYTILERNARTQYGEIDLVARQELPKDDPGKAGATSAGSVTVFVEVKTRTSRTYGLPEEAITPSKQAHMLDAAQAYLMDHPELEGDWRLDVIAIQSFPAPQQPLITHFENAFT